MSHASRSRRLVLLLSLPVLLACPGPAAESTPGSAASDSSASLPVDSGAALPGSQAECPETGLWRECSLEKRLERAGFLAIRQDEEVLHDFLDVPGTAYLLGRDELQVFIYPSADDRERDLADVDSATVSPIGESVDWEATPTLIVSNNLAAILIGGTSRQVERVQLALTAGLPQP